MVGIGTLVNISSNPLKLNTTIWWRDPASFFSKSTYKILYVISAIGFPHDPKLTIMLALMWRSWVLSNIDFFACMFLLRRFPTRDELAKLANRGILVGEHNLVCPFCLGQVEDLDHLFLFCLVASRVWLIMLKRMGLCLLPSQEDVLFHLVIAS